MKTIINRLNHEQHHLENKLKVMRAADPELSLKRGFALVLDDDGQLIRPVNNLIQGQQLKTRVWDGVV